jgi:hypothetical protein
MEIAVKQVTALLREFSLRSILFGAVFVIMFAVADIVDLAGLLQFSGIIRGLPRNIAELGGILTAVTIFPFLAMGMSISVDTTKNTRERLSRDLH